jgi:hypothetical protein
MCSFLLIRINDVLALFRLTRLCVRSLSIDPFPDVRRTVPESDAVVFAKCQDCDGLAINQTDVPEIDINCTGFLLDRSTKNVDVFISNPPTQVQDCSTFFSQESVDSADHCSFALFLFRRLPAAAPCVSRPDGGPPGRWLLDRSGLDRAVSGRKGANLTPSQIIEN